MLATYPMGPETGTPLLIAHGLFGSARNWNAIARSLADDRPVLTVDMRNHGESFRDPRNGYEEMADDLADVIAENGGCADVLGHSMGGKAAMMLALTRPEMVSRLIVADISPVPYDHGQMKLVEAMRNMDLSGLTRRSQADARLAETVEDAGIRAFLLQSLDLKSDPPRWRLNLDVLADQMPRILDWPNVDGPYEGPTLFLSGSESDYVLPKYRKVTRALFPKARFARITGAGHWLHAEKPNDFSASVAAMLTS